MTRKPNPFAELLSQNRPAEKPRHPTDDPGHDYDQTSSEAPAIPGAVSSSE